METIWRVEKPQYDESNNLSWIVGRADTLKDAYLDLAKKTLVENEEVFIVSKSDNYLAISFGNGDSGLSAIAKTEQEAVDNLKAIILHKSH